MIFDLLTLIFRLAYLVLLILSPLGLLVSIIMFFVAKKAKNHTRFKQANKVLRTSLMGLLIYPFVLILAFIEFQNPWISFAVTRRITISTFFYTSVIFSFIIVIGSSLLYIFFRLIQESYYVKIFQKIFKKSGLFLIGLFIFLLITVLLELQVPGFSLGLTKSPEGFIRWLLTN